MIIDSMLERKMSFSHLIMTFNTFSPRYGTLCRNISIAHEIQEATQELQFNR